MRYILFVIATLILSTSVNASEIQPDDIAYTSTDGTQWLKLSLTLGYSLEEAITAYDGFTIATKTQFDDMFSNFNPAPATTPISTSINHEVYSGLPPEAVSFQHVFGLTGVDFYSPYTHEYSYGFYSDSGTILMGGIRHSSDSTDASYENTYYWHDALFTSGINISGHRAYSYFLVSFTSIGEGYPVTPIVSGGNGAISPDTTQSVIINNTTQFTLTPDLGYRVGSVTGTCGGSLNGDIFTTYPVTGNCAVIASFFIDGGYSVTPSVSGGNGFISPDTTQSVIINNTTQFNLTPNFGYHIDSVTGTCGGSLADDIFTTYRVTSDCTVIADFAINSYEVIPSVDGGNGTISPDTNQNINYNTTAQFTFVPDFGYHVENVTGTCGGSLDGNIYTTDFVTADCTVVASFSDSYSVAPSVSGSNGSISPDIVQSVTNASTTQFILVPEPGYHVDNVTGTCSGTLSGDTFVTSPITSDCTVIASFAINTYTVTSLDGLNGSITPKTQQSVAYNSKPQFTLTPDFGYHIDSVTGTCGGTLSDNIFTTNYITADCTVIANFEINSYSVSPSVFGGNGTISPESVLAIAHNGTIQFTLTPDLDYEVDSVVGTCGGTLSANTFTTNPITGDCSVIVIFEYIFKLTSTSFENHGWIPDRFTGVADDISPPINWEYPPIGTLSLVLVVADLDGTDPFWGDDWKHWLVYNIPSSTAGLQENSGAEGAVNLPIGAKHGATSWWEANYRPGNYYQGPLPPLGSGEHRYIYRLFALDIAELNPVDDTGEGPSYNELYSAMDGHVLGFAELEGRYTQDLRYTVTPSSGAYGSINPDLPQLVTSGYTTPFILTADVGYMVDSVTGSCGGTLTDNIFNTDPVSIDCTVLASFFINRKGDVNNDTFIDLKDAVLTLQVVTDSVPVEATIYRGGDVNLDGHIGLEEAVYVLREVAGLNSQPILTVTSAGQVWMDRNLGASRVATSSIDSEAYGDLYQWGRLADGHEKCTSSTTSITSLVDYPNHGDFITTSTFPYDWRDPQNNSLWQSISGINTPCPDGFRLPTEAEWETERGSWSSNNSFGAFASPLKLTLAGFRKEDNTLWDNIDTGFYWTSTVDGNMSRYLNISDSNNTMVGTNLRGRGYSVRCIKD